MDAIDALRSRRSVRRYRPGTVPREVLEEIVDCGRLAASARNVQPWEFVVITDRGLLQRLADIADHGRHIAKAAACIVVLCQDGKYFLEDGCAATQNILVAAQARGLGTCWVAGDKKLYADTVRRMLQAPDSHRLVSLIPIGYPDERPSIEKRSLASVLHWDKF